MNRISPETIEATLSAFQNERPDVLAAAMGRDDLTMESVKSRILEVACYLVMGCCCSVFVLFVFVAYIVGFVGLAHTQHVNLDPSCPAGYWSTSLALILSRMGFFVLSLVLAACARCSGSVCMAMFSSVFGLCVILSFTVANTAVTAEAWNALNCTEAVRASRDADPLLMASGSLFILTDWILLILACAGMVSYLVSQADP
jgi:hypothetical protein